MLVGSRTEVKNFLKAGRVTVNGKKEKSAKLQINEDTDKICFDGQKLDYEEFVYYMMNKHRIRTKKAAWLGDLIFL